jgi:hypothetical protein
MGTHFEVLGQFYAPTKYSTKVNRSFKKSVIYFHIEKIR